MPDLGIYLFYGADDGNVISQINLVFSIHNMPKNT